MQSIWLHDIKKIKHHTNSIPADPNGSHGKVISNHIEFTDSKNNLTDITFFQEDEIKWKVIIKELKPKKDKK